MKDFVSFKDAACFYTNRKIYMLPHDNLLFKLYEKGANPQEVGETFAEGSNEKLLELFDKYQVTVEDLTNV